MSELLGTVGRLRRYPVKSMLGEDLDAADIGERGLGGDRRRAVLDVATGRIASAKNPRLWRGLLTLDGTRPPGDAELSALLGRQVRLVDVPPEEAELERGDGAGWVRGERLGGGRGARRRRRGAGGHRPHAPVRGRPGAATRPVSPGRVP
ncbi:MOSC N-terminal beta barrel domain-containing protein [Nonomuraea sp. NPDC050691]|uniref:MOSC N-terminal beta barrel domain-containing protein n=1 Tax=Nonomuraea sp. NPDC050691 TaxID=3155661 RepID=UPI0033E27651